MVATLLLPMMIVGVSVLCSNTNTNTNSASPLPSSPQLPVFYCNSLLVTIEISDNFLVFQVPVFFRSVSDLLNTDTMPSQPSTPQPPTYTAHWATNSNLIIIFTDNAMLDFLMTAL